MHGKKHSDDPSLDRLVSMSTWRLGRVSNHMKLGVGMQNLMIVNDCKTIPAKEEHTQKAGLEN